MLISSRKDAQRVGAGQYFTGKPCKKGHTANRYTQSGACAACVAAAASAARGGQHSGIVIPRAQREAEHMAKIQNLLTNRAEKTDALKRLVEIKVPIHTRDLATVFDTAVELCLAAYPVLERSDVYPDTVPLRWSPLYRVNVPPEQVDLVRGVADALWTAHGTDVSRVADRVAEQMEQAAENEDNGEPPAGWK